MRKKKSVQIEGAYLNGALESEEVEAFVNEMEMAKVIPLSVTNSTTSFQTSCLGSML